MTEEYSKYNDELDQQQSEKELFPSEYSLFAQRRIYPEQGIENLLEFAEDIKKICDNYVDKLEQLVALRDIILGFLGFFYCLCFVIFYFFINYQYDDMAKIVSALFQCFMGLSFLLLFIIPLVTIPLNSRINKIQAKLNYEQSVLIKTVDLIREVTALLVTNNQWTKIQEIEFKIRLSRFNTGRYEIPKSVLKEILSLLTIKIF